MYKTRLMIVLSCVSLLGACNASTTTEDSDSSSSSMMMEDASSSFDPNAPFLDDDASSSDGVELNVHSSESASAMTTSVPSAAVPRVITVSVTDWSFSPTMINVKKGEKVQLKLVGGTGIHSFAVPGLDMNVRIEAGQTVIVDLPTDIAGSFDASCRIPCGPGHKDMKATVVIA